MNTPFPFGLPWPTAFYLVLYVVTLVIHVVFMNYVLAGSAYLAVTGVFTGGIEQRQRAPVASVLRDWLPFMLGAAITAGVAPLLFIQILYKQRFYTANLLGFNRWMLILPILIVAFYLLYLLKSRRISRWPVSVRMLTGGVVFACFGFVAYSWSENYLLSTQQQETWNRIYLEGTTFYYHPELLARLSVWFIGALPTMVWMVSWQLWYGQPSDAAVAAREVRRTGSIGLLGLAFAVGAGCWYYAVADQETRAAFTNALALPYVVAAVAGVLVQAVVWWRQRREKLFHRAWLAVGSGGAVLTILGMTVARESVRLNSVDVSRLFERHARAAEVGGLPVFLAFFVINGLLIAWCFRIVRTEQVPHAGLPRQAPRP